MMKLIQYCSALLVLPFLPFRPGKTRVLALVNLARQAMGLPDLNALPAGQPGKALSCPLSLALGGMVGAGAICFDDGYHARCVARAWQKPIRQHADGRYLVDLPSLLCRFVADFDLGAFPSLASGPAPRMPAPSFGAPRTTAA